MIRVTANREGYYKSKVRQVGDQFSVDSEAELGTWMDLDKKEIEVSEVIEEPIQPKKKGKAVVNDLI